MKQGWKWLSAIAGSVVLAAACGGTSDTSDSGTGNDASVAETAPAETGPTCASPEKMCGALCTNLETDNANCGSCGNACASGKVCASGQCALTCGSLTTCSGDGGAPYCANTQTDNANCGACGNTCASGTVCAGGKCALTCGSLTTCTPDGGAPYCASTQTDDANCGACGNTCPSGETCAAGKCGVTCGSLTTCTPDGGAPYCANTQSDNANCGSCGKTCPLGQSCTSGICQLPPGSPAAGCLSNGSDPSWSSVIAYVSCTDNAIIDEASKSSVLTYNGPTVASALPAGAPGGSSCKLGSAGAYGTAKGFAVTLPSALLTGDFTVEFSVYQTAWYDPNDQQSNIISSSNAYIPNAGFFPTFTSNLQQNELLVVPGTGATFKDPGSALNTWESYAISRVQGTDYVFRQGALLTSFVDGTSYSDTTFYVGHQANGPYNALMGSIGQIRVTKLGRYTSSYTPCSGAFAKQ